MDSVVLIGPRGSGKTAVGKRLSEMLDFPFVDADEEFARLHGTIKDFVDQHDWEEFRKLEAKLIAGICAQYQDARIVLASGGGAVAHDQGEQYGARNVELLRGLGLIFYLLPSHNLKKSAHILAYRTRGSRDSVHYRPPLTGGSSPFDEMFSILQERHPLYVAAAQHVIYTGRRRPESVAKGVYILYKSIKG